MGCGKSTGGPTPEAARRRLSVGHVDNSAGDNANEEKANEDDRGTLKALAEQDVIAMIAQTGDRKFSLGSATDQGKTSFANKSVATIGDKPKDDELKGLGYTCRKGLKPESPNQDSWSVLTFESWALYGVFDGHGQKGHDVSNMVKEDLFKLIIKDQRFKTDDDSMGKMLRDVFKKMQSLIATADRMKKVSAQLSGTTASVVLHDMEQNKLHIAHVADSTVCLASWTDASKTTLKCRALTRDHKPDLKDEKARIEKNGGRVVFDGYANHRIYAKTGRYPGLNMSRCLGDLLGHADAGVSAEPEVSVHAITDLDHILFLCSDGVWEFMEPDKAAEIVKPHPAIQAQAAADKLAKEAWDLWIREEGGAVVDDITAVLIYLQTYGKKE
jgi:serine/threonine protein phosphatase PrpC